MTAKTKQTAQPSQGAVRLSIERISQLKMLAEQRQSSIGDVLGELVRREIEAGGLPLDIPGITFDESADTVTINAAEFSLAVQRQLMGDLADRLREVIDTRKFARLNLGKAKAMIRYQGPGVKVINLDTGASYVAAPAVMHDVADMIERHATH